MTYLKLGFTALLVLLVSACSLDVTDPNTATDEEVLTSREGIISFTTGMQGYFKETALEAAIRTPAVTTRELAINTTFANLIDLEDGGVTLQDDNANILQNWSRLLRVVDMTTKIIESVDGVQLSDAERSEILIITHIHKAMALGFLVSNFEQSPINTTPTGNAEFFSRADVLAEAIDLLSTAQTVLDSSTPSTSIRTQGFEFENTIQALLARYNLMAGNYTDAINAADNVDPSVESIFFFDGTTSRNPVFENVFTSENFAPQDLFGSELTETADERLDFFLSEDDTTSAPNEFEIEVLEGFFSSASSAIPVYRPGEMNLIRAEAYVMTDQPGLALDEINAVRNKMASEDIYGIGANLPNYSGGTSDAELFEEIYRQRRAELFLTGMSMEDMRRLNRPDVPDNPELSAERNRNYYPYPEQERQTNPNTPENPPI
jgi:hypothetical protein